MDEWYNKKGYKALPLQNHGKARPQHGKTKSPSALSRFLNRYPWPTRALIRLVRKEAQVALDPVTLEKRGPPPLLLSRQGRLHRVVLYLVYGDLRLPWAYRPFRRRPSPPWPLSHPERAGPSGYG